MGEITGILLSEWRPDGTVCITFIAEGANEKDLSLVVKDLDTAEADLVHSFHLKPELAAALRAGMARNRLVFLGMTVKKEEIAAMLLTHA
jgi:hypothetical protein